MAATLRQRNCENHEDDAPKSQTSVGESGLSDPGPRGRRLAGGCLRRVASAVFCVAAIVTVGLTALHLQNAADERREMSARQVKDARLIANMATKLDSVVLQINVLRRVVDGLETSTGTTRVELEKNKLRTTSVEEALQKLQSDPSASGSGVSGKLAAWVQATEGALAGLKQEMEALRRSLAMLQSNMGDTHTELTLKKYDMDQQVKRFEERLAALEAGTRSSVDLE